MLTTILIYLAGLVVSYAILYAIFKTMLFTIEDRLFLLVCSLASWITVIAALMFFCVEVLPTLRKKK